MKDRIQTLILYSNGAGWKSIAADTVIRGVLGVQADESILPRRLQQTYLAKKLLGKRYETLGYVNDWLEAFCDCPMLDVDVCNINNLVEYSAHRKAIESYSLVIIMHSATGDSMELLLKTASWFQRRRGKLVVFIGNEYDLMARKIRFLRSAGADYVCTQIPVETARWLYAECEGTKVLAMPHALNPRAYRPDPHRRRSVDVGFRGDAFPLYIGDTERTDIISAFRARGPSMGLRCDIQFRRVTSLQWAQFLQSCKGLVGGESGTYYLDRRGEILNQSKAYIAKHPAATMGELHERFFSDPPEHRSVKCISSRHFEAIGTKTAQILLEGGFNGILRADEHYISVRKDISNFEEAVGRFNDDSYREAMADRAYEYVMSGHTYRHRVESLLGQLF